jgi:hypothetical protein
MAKVTNMFFLVFSLNALRFSSSILTLLTLLFSLQNFLNLNLSNLKYVLVDIIIKESINSNNIKHIESQELITKEYLISEPNIKEELAHQSVPRIPKVQ